MLPHDSGKVPTSGLLCSDRTESCIVSVGCQTSLSALLELNMTDNTCTVTSRQCLVPHKQLVIVAAFTPSQKINGSNIVEHLSSLVHCKTHPS